MNKKINIDKLGVRANDDSPLPNRKSVRLAGYDYASEGLYFITICCKNFKCLFGEINHGKMQLNNAGKFAEKCWLDIPNHYPQVRLHEFVIMPNHVHGMIEIVNDSNALYTVGAKHFSPANDGRKNSPANDGRKNLSGQINANQPTGTSNTIGAMVRGFKIGVTKWMKQNTNVNDVWQRSFYEHIIKTAKSYDNISNYIRENPINWPTDKFYTVGANHHSPVSNHHSPVSNHHSPVSNHHSPSSNMIDMLSDKTVLEKYEEEENK